MKTILTGCLGFVGSNVHFRLGGFGVDDLFFGSRDNISGKWAHMGFEEIPQSALDDYDVLIHMATSNIIYAQYHPIETFNNNTLKTIELFSKFKGKIVYTSTASIYGQADVIPTPETYPRNLTNAYDTSKYIAECFLKQRGNYTTLRLSNVFGVNQRPSNPYCGVIGRLLQQALNGAAMTIIGDGSQTRDFTYVDDVVDAIEMAVNQPAKDTEINIATGKETSILALATCIRELGIKSEIESIPPRAIDRLTRRCLDISKAEKVLGWKPKTSLGSGLCKTIEWMTKESANTIEVSGLSVY